jgi:NodT family efflux transporter outer membrane factor (OMF) lipoprotein
MRYSSTCLVALALLAVPGCHRERHVSDKADATTASDRKDLADRLTGPFDASATHALEREFWKTFGDPVLDDLVAQAVGGNLDLKLLLNRVDQARLTVSSQEAEKLLKFSASVSQPTSRSSQSSQIESTTRLNAHVSWEADIWGRLEAADRAAFEGFKATDADWRGGYLKVINDLTSVYFSIRMLDEQHDLHTWAFREAKAVLDLYVDRQQAGLVGPERAAAQRAEVLRLQSDLADIERQRELLCMQLNLLMGKAPHEVKLDPKPLTKTIALVGLPTRLSPEAITRRPDVIAADYRLREAYFSEESARVARFPRVTLDIDYTLSVKKLTSLTDNWMLSLIPAITFPALDPQTELELRKKGIEVEARRVEYRKVIVAAVHDIEGALVNAAYRRRQFDFERQRVAELESSYQRAMERFRTGLINHLEVFEVERTLLDARQRELEDYRSVLSETSRLYISLGGGW